MIELNGNDIEYLKEFGLDKQTVDRQYQQFVDGIAPVSLVAPANPESGILRFSEPQLTNFENYFDEYSPNIQISRFVPASGAASRMFKSFFQFLESGTEDQEIEIFANGLNSFAFYNQIKCNNETDYRCAIDKMLNELKLADLPKALIPFHSYHSTSRTAFEEHLVESALILADNNDINIHFTISKAHKELFTELMEKLPLLSASASAHFAITFSYQSHATDTIAVDSDNQLVRNEDGSIMLRPGGHGSLLMNLNDLTADLIFVKNIDNVQPDHLKVETVLYKKILAGYLVSTQGEIKDNLLKLENENSDLTKAQHFVENELNIRIPESYNRLDSMEKRNFLRTKLNRPMRVCGMVKNEGEPGGGPFWIRNTSGDESLQIVEASQIDMQDEQQVDIFQQSSYFNPVDLVCWIKDYQGNKFDLNKFTDRDASFISDKSQAGKTFKVLEHPGLWNGAMADWITLFVEVPIATFSPVKRVTDLLRPQHQPA